jgi:hypothetical protein
MLLLSYHPVELLLLLSCLQHSENSVSSEEEGTAQGCCNQMRIFCQSCPNASRQPTIFVEDASSLRDLFILNWKSKFGPEIFYIEQGVSRKQNLRLVHREKMYLRLHSVVQHKEFDESGFTKNHIPFK